MFEGRRGAGQGALGREAGKTADRGAGEDSETGGSEHPL